MYFSAWWSADGITLAGALDLENNPRKGADACYGLSPAQMVTWIQDFSDTYVSKTSRYPVIYMTKSWWEQCTGDSVAFGSTNPLWIAHPGTSLAGHLPQGWKTATFWQYALSGSNPGDQDYFIGDSAALKSFARG
ncbi:glycoside hydrolase family 25 protein [Penicillium cataractarum]|uniref:Glycoside hydrolase family 25 protein n=1 Tax=Penicillium cataractarum TaxID=2100454 RepID=A0A9W9V9F0_9EURO|nr:glycoside hydrolase family 25 protein [Penicillium cataractarum]KAJ5371260.1 glycoside hydrolase family 25 protein [Penicillium cataractarum]